MAQHKESDFIIPVLKAIKNCQGECTTEYIKKNIHNYIELNEEDLLPYPSRSKKEPRCYQVIGNLISHKNAVLFSYINSTNLITKNGKITPRKLFSLNEAGEKYIKELFDDNCDCDDVEKKSDSCKETETQCVPTQEALVDPFDEKIMNHVINKGLNKRPPTNPKIAETVIRLSGYKCEYACSVGKKHNSFLDKTGHPFMHGHHLIPMKASKDFFPLNLDRPSNIVSLCTECHALLHHGTEKEKIAILRVLYDNHIEQLNADGIYISFEKLLRYYQ